MKDVCVPMMIAMRELGYSQASIGKAFGVSRDVVQYRTSRKNGISSHFKPRFTRSTRKTCNCRPRSLICKAAVAIASEILEIDDSTCAEMFGISSATVCVVRRERGINFRGVTNHEEIIRELNSSGLTDSEIARRIGITQSCVSKLRRKLGLVSNHVRENPLYAPGNTVELTNGKAVIIGRTEGSKRRHDIKCCKCGHVFSRILNDADGIRCPNCHKEELDMNRLLKSKQLVLPMSFAKPVEYMDLDLECECQCCGKAFTERDWEKYRDTSKRRGRRHTTCSPECQKAFARHKRKGIVTVHWSKVAEHYKTDRCYLCGAKIDVNDYSKTDEGYFIAGPYYPSTDHVVAIANGGDGSMENSRLAHCICNSYKSDIPLRDFKGVQDVRIAC